MTRRPLRGFAPSRLAAAIEASGMSVDEVARLADTTPQTLRNWLSSASSPTVDVLYRVVAQLGITMREVLDIDPDRSNLTDLRVLAGLTQRQLAAAAGLGEETVGQLERGTARLRNRHAAALAAALAVPAPVVVAAHAATRQRDAGAAP
ncbi:helix-turn-helix domain-containing protein [Nocardia sp. NPDC004711]